MTDLSESAVAQRVPSLVDRPISVLSRRDPIAVDPTASLADCLVAIQRGGVGDSVLVIDPAGTLVGVLTERDIFARFAGATGIDLGAPVASMLTRDAKRLTMTTTIRAAMELMATGRYRNVPIVDAAGVVVGIVRQQDILRYLAEAFPEELLNLPPRPHQRIKEPEGA